MRRILNLNRPGILFLKLIGLLAVVIPGALYGTLLFLDQAGFVRVIHSVIRISFAAGGLLFVVLLVLVIAEQIQDHYIDAQYQKSRGRKLPLADGTYECKYCGNRKVRAGDRTCQVCGRELE